MVGEVSKFVAAAGGVNAVADVVAVTRQAVGYWIEKNEIARRHLPALEKLSRDKKCFMLFRKAALARGGYEAD